MSEKQGVAQQVMTEALDVTDDGLPFQKTKADAYRLGISDLYTELSREARAVIDEAAAGQLRIFGEPVDPFYLVAFKYLVNRLGLDLEGEDAS